MTLRMCELNVDTDCSMPLPVAHIGIDAVEHREDAAVIRRYLQSRLVHQREQPDRLHGDRLAAGVRTRYDQNRPVRTNAHIHRHGVPAQHRMARVDEGAPTCRRWEKSFLPQRGEGWGWG